MRKNWSGRQFVDFLIQIGVTRLGVIKGFTKHRHEKRLPASKHVILEDDDVD